MLRHELVQTLRLLLVTHTRYRPRWARKTRETVKLEQREVARAVRCLPGRFTDRLPERTLQRISIAASGGQWERVMADLIASLRAHNQPVTPEERDRLRTLLEALSLPTGALHDLRTRQ
jgi:hypothetical protein